MRENLQVAEIIAKGVGRGGVTNHCKWVIGRAPGHQRAGGSLTDDRARPPCNGTVRSPLRELGYPGVHRLTGGQIFTGLFVSL